MMEQGDKVFHYFRGAELAFNAGVDGAMELCRIISCVH